VEAQPTDAQPVVNAPGDDEESDVLIRRRGFLWSRGLEPDFAKAKPSAFHEYRSPFSAKGVLPTALRRWKQAEEDVRINRKCRREDGDE